LDAQGRVVLECQVIVSDGYEIVDYVEHASGLNEKNYLNPKEDLPLLSINQVGEELHKILNSPGFRRLFVWNKDAERKALAIDSVAGLAVLWEDAVFDLPFSSHLQRKVDWKGPETPSLAEVCRALTGWSVQEPVRVVAHTHKGDRTTLHRLWATSPDTVAYWHHGVKTTMW